MEQIQSIISAPVSFSDAAIEELKKIAKLPESEGQTLRVGVKGGGCSGMSYVLGFDEVTEFDEHYSINGLPFIMDKRHSIYLMNMHIDFQDGLNARGFAFSNPNAKQTCGCGTSFSA